MTQHSEDTLDIGEESFGAVQLDSVSEFTEMNESSNDQIKDLELLLDNQSNEQNLASDASAL